VGEFHRLRVAEVVRETADAVSVVLAVPPEL
jgi:ferredoxin-NADP reductase